MLKHFLIATGLAAVFSLSAAQYKLHTWKKIHLTPNFWSEGGHFSDFDDPVVVKPGIENLGIDSFVRPS